MRHALIVFIGFVLFVVVFAGYKMGSDQKPRSNLSMAPKQEQLYYIVNPSIGVIEKRLPVDFVYEADGTISAVAPTALVDQLHDRPTTLIFGKYGDVLAETATLSGIATDLQSPEESLLSFSMPEHVAEMRPEHGAIILLKNPVARRLPYSARQPYEGNGYIVWSVIIQNSDATIGRLVSKQVNGGLEDGQFFDGGYAIQANDYIVVNPDPDFENGQDIPIKPVVLDIAEMTDRDKAIQDKAMTNQMCNYLDPGDNSALGCGCGSFSEASGAGCP